MKLFTFNWLQSDWIIYWKLFSYLFKIISLFIKYSLFEIMYKMLTLMRMIKDNNHDNKKWLNNWIIEKEKDYLNGLLSGGTTL